MSFKKIIKIIVGVVVFLTLPSLLFFGFIYFKYNEDLPVGIEGEKADLLANKMLDALNYEAYNATNYLEWTFKNSHHYKWQKDEHVCEVFWKQFRIVLNLNNTAQSKVYANNFEVTNQNKDLLIKTAITYFNNDSFWLVAPYKVFDPGVKRSLVKENGKDALLVTYTSGGSTPGDSYLWILDDSYRPIGYKMWTSIIPIQGFPASWNDWTTTESGAILPTNHKLLFFNLSMGEVKGLK